ncbi:MAG TPA: sigma-70 family RNA polymerase sigma factor [Bryobacteraceae bacterium]|nr:sigma-70 family RNA polymerase sigma factor [Bryobacteraceae bacterium]
MPESPDFSIPAAIEHAAGRVDAPSPLEAEVVGLFDQLRDPLLRYLLSFRLLVVQDCDEIIQDAFLALFQHLQRGRSRHNLRAWLFRVANNLALKRLQRLRRDSENRLELSNTTPELAADPALNPEDAFARAQVQQRLLAVVRALPEQDQRCLVLRAEGLRYREIAEVLGVSLGAVAKSLERSLARVARAAAR